MWRGEMPVIVSRGPNQATGYYNSALLYGGSGSGMGAPMAGTQSLASGSGVNIGGQSWHPTVLYLAALVVAEMVIFGFIGHLLGK
jgi:hypothetical protein